MIQKRFTVATSVVGAFLVLGCGKARDVRDVAPSATGGDGGATAGDGAVSGGSGGVGGSGQAGHVGGAPTWDPQQCHATPVPEPSDPTAAEQWSLARTFCGALRAQGCFMTGAVLTVAGCTADQELEACVAQVLWSHYNNVTSACEDLWRTDIECGTNSILVPPSCGNVSTLGPYGSSETCAQENAALYDCYEQHGTVVEVAGSYTTCQYSPASVSASECVASCQVGQNLAELHCYGAEGLPKQCACWINGHITAGSNAIFVSDCADAAAQAADGLCTGKLDCCFAYLDKDKQACRCEQPAEYGYDSCEAMMAVAHGQRVDICPALAPDNGGGCWPPGQCSP